MLTHALTRLYLCVYIILLQTHFYSYVYIYYHSQVYAYTYTHTIYLQIYTTIQLYQSERKYHRSNTIATRVRDEYPLTSEVMQRYTNTTKVSGLRALDILPY